MKLASCKSALNIPSPYFALVFFSPFSIAITSHGQKRANLSVFRTFVRFVLVWVFRFPLLLGVWGRAAVLIVAFPGLFLLPFSLCALNNANRT